MPNLKLTINVPQGNVNTALPQESIGTDGCGTCVGIIVVDNRNFKVCGHIDCAIPETGDMTQVESRATAILAERFPTKENTVRVGYCTTSLEATTAAIINAITLRYGEKVTLHSTEHMGIYANVAGAIHPMSMNHFIVTLPLIANGLAKIV